ncbi:MAG TPA: tetratricopeptide repeat protein [Pyrinomonadaceae bacterium]|nr:tetratricopeptide repeat protein [Pyrinomonadaceae bacterium]
MAKYSKKRQRELKKDQFRDKTMQVLDRVGDRLEGKGRLILYILGGIVAFAILAGIFSWWSNKKSQEAAQALGRAIEVVSTPIQAQPVPGSTQPSFPTEKARAERAAAEFQKVADKYSGQTREIARYFIAVSNLTLDRNKGLGELDALTKSGYKDVAAQARFALAQAREADGQMDGAVALYQQLAQENNPAIPAETVNLRLASIYEKQGKTKEAVDLYFQIADNSRKAKSPDGKPLPKSSAAREAETKLQKLDAARYAQLPPEAPSDLPLS